MNIYQIAFVSLTAMLAVACNTVQGVGQDVEAAGEKIEDVAEHNKPE